MDALRRMTPFLMLSALLAMVFSSGILLGMALRNPVCPNSPPRHRPGGIPPHLRGLDLTPEQEARMREIGRKYQPELDRIRQRIRPEVEAVFQKMDRELREHLTPEQIRKWEEMERERGMEPGPPPGPPMDAFPGGSFREPPPGPPPGIR